MAVGACKVRQSKWFWKRQRRAGKQAERGHHQEKPKEAMRPKHRHKTQQAKKSGEFYPLNTLLGVVCQPAPQIGRKNAADLKQWHENANISCREMLGLQIQAPIRHKRADKEVVNEVEAGKVGVKRVAQNGNF